MRVTVRPLAIGVFALAAAIPAPAQAAIITFSNMTATWSDVNGGLAVGFTANGTSDARVSWGTVDPTLTTGQSGYRFQGAGAPINAELPPNPTNDFVLGTFTHSNNPIQAGSSITGVRLTISTDVALDGNPLGNYQFVYDVSHNETPNGDNPCADGGAFGVGVNVNGCADNVLMNYNLLSDSFLVDGTLYTLDIRGFELLNPPNTKVFSFWTTERADNQAYVLARVASRAQVAPEPATLALFGVGLAAAAVRRRRASC